MLYQGIGKTVVRNNLYIALNIMYILLAIEKNDLGLTKPIIGDIYNIGNAKATIVAPYSTSYDNLNDYSVGIRLDYGSTSFLFTGDADRHSEREMVSHHSTLSLDVDVLLIPHHGSNSSSTNKFLKAASSKIGVIQSGADNSYGHPHSEVLERLGQFNVEIYRNDLHGTVIITSDGGHIQIKTEKTPKEANAPPGKDNEEDTQREEGSTNQEGVDINAASLDELQEIIHIGPAYAEQIMELRPFKNLNDLTRVNGIGDGRLRDIKDQGRAFVE